jgi:TonB family protein
MRMRCCVVLFLLCSAICISAQNGSPPNGSAQRQESPSQAGRKLVRKTTPAYPDVARKMSLGGTVKVLAVVSADGSVKKVEPVGGSPVLIQAAEDAVSRWKYAPADGESREVVELHFNP